MNEPKNFHWADYLVFAIFLVFSSLIGVFFGVKDRHRMTSKNFLMGGGDIHWALVALSMQASFLSAIFILSIPVEVYVWGTIYYYFVLAYFIAIPFSGHFYMPIFYKLKILSAYEYLEIRFSKTVRTVCALIFCVQILLYLSVVLYTPALAIAQVTDLTIPVSIAVCGLVCTFYTFLGGMKATMWNDFFQMIIIASTLLCIIIFGTVKVGSFSDVWKISKDGGRVNFNDFRLNPTIKTNFWTQTIGGSIVNLTIYGANQTTIQKFNSIKNLRDAKKSIWLTTCSSAIFLTLVCFAGLVAYANYWDCDPLSDGKIMKYDQIVPYLAMDVMGHLHGLPGLFIAATFSAALSSLSGSLTALSAVILSDFVTPLWQMMKGRKMEERMKSFLSKTFTLTLGLLITGMGFAAQYFGDVVVQVSIGIFGFVGGPLLGVVTLGIFVPFINSFGVICGLLTSLTFSSWIAIGSTVAQVSHETLPMNISGCYGNVTSGITMVTILGDAISHNNLDESDVLIIYKISYMYYGLVALIISTVVAIPVSLITGRTKSVDSKLIVNCHKKCCCCFPKLGTCCFCRTIMEGVESEVIEEISHAEIFNNDTFELNMKISSDNIPTTKNDMHEFNKTSGPHNSDWSIQTDQSEATINESNAIGNGNIKSFEDSF